MLKKLNIKIKDFIHLKFFIFFCFSIFFLQSNNNFEYSSKIRKNFSYFTNKIYIISAFPSLAYKNIYSYLEYKISLIKKNEKLQNKTLIQSGIIQQIPGLIEENNKLKKLLDSNNFYELHKITLAERIPVNLSTYSNKILINIGLNKNISLRQVVIDNNAILGQISEVNKNYSTVTLISSPDHALLAINARTNKKIIVHGSGDNKKLLGKYVPFNEDIINGDILISSGLDNIFPAGYLIGVVTKIKRDKSEDYINLQIKPYALLDDINKILVLSK